MEQDIVYVCNVCNFSSANHTVVEEHMQSHSFTSDFSALQGVSARFVEHNVHVVNYNDKAPEPASLQSAEKIWCKEKANVTITTQQCDTKWKGMLKMYKQIKDANAKSGNSPKNWEYFDYLDNILFNKPEINPVATCSIQKGLIQMNTNNHVHQVPHHLLKRNLNAVVEKENND
ncbi:hypothetical protein FQA39_LY13404 [Lamprigera yunnana]|nr:hypothetical protein FQA39_LY13404 [Lamprigera yunnana]